MTITCLSQVSGTIYRLIKTVLVPSPRQYCINTFSDKSEIFLEKSLHKHRHKNNAQKTIQNRQNVNEQF